MDQPAKKPRGAPRKENPETADMHFRVSPERKARYERAAAKLKLALSAWAKRVLDRASKR
jgi:predicted HicB family RNase H-like nuclease